MPRRADLPLRLVESIGTDDVAIRLGDSLALRLPRAAGAAVGITKEQQLVPRIAPSAGTGCRTGRVRHAGARVTRGRGRCICGFRGPIRNPDEAGVGLAGDLAGFVTTLRGIDTFGLTARDSLHSYRAESIQLRDATTRRCLAQCAALLDAAWSRR